MGFYLGQVVTTRGVSAIYKQHKLFFGFINKCLQRHKTRDWGDTAEEDKISNNYALVEGSRIISVYLIPSSLLLGIERDRIWIITEAVGESGIRASTCVLFPDEY